MGLGMRVQGVGIRVEGLGFSVIQCRRFKYQTNGESNGQHGIWMEAGFLYGNSGLWLVGASKVKYTITKRMRITSRYCL